MSQGCPEIEEIMSELRRVLPERTVSEYNRMYEAVAKAYEKGKTAGARESRYDPKTPISSREGHA